MRPAWLEARLRSRRFRGTFAILLVMVVYAGNFVACRYSLQHGLSPFDLVALRYLVAGLILLPYFCRLGLRDLDGIGWPRGIILCLLAGSPYIFVFFSGLSLAPAAHGAVLNPGVVPSVVFAGLAWLGLESVSLTKIGSMVLIVLGLMLVTGYSFYAQREVLIGDGLLFATGISWGIFTLLMKLWALRPLQSAAIVSVISMIYLPFYFALSFRGFPSVSMTHIVLQAVFQGVIAAIGTVCLITYAVHTLGAQRTALFSPLVPVMTTLLALWALAETVTISQCAGVLMVTVGMAVAAAASNEVPHGREQGAST